MNLKNCPLPGRVINTLFEGRFGNNALYRYTLYDERYAPAGCIASEEDFRRVLKLLRLCRFQDGGFEGSQRESFS